MRRRRRPTQRLGSRVQPPHAGNVAGRAPVLGVALLLCATVLTQPATADHQSDQFRATASSLLEPERGLQDVDRRAGRVRPTEKQRDLVERMEASARWNRFGTPQFLGRHDGADLAIDLTGTPVEMARAFLAEYHALFRMSRRTVAELELVNAVPLTNAIDATGKPVDARVVVFRQRFGVLPAGEDGLLTVGVVDDRVTYVSSSAIGDADAPAPATLTSAEAWRAAAADAGRTVSRDAVRPIHQATRPGRWTSFAVTGLAQVQRARLVAVGLPDRGVRAAYEVNVVDVEASSVLAVTSYVDARSGEVLIRRSRVDNGVDEPSEPTATRNNNAITESAWTGPLSRRAMAPAQDATFTNAWRRSRCDPGGFVPGGNDVAAARATVFGLHDRMHDWAYELGFTEQAYNLQEENPSDRPRPRGVPGGGDADRMRGFVQAGAPTGGYPTYVGRNNASQVTLQDGLPSYSTHYLFQPVAASWYGPCADGAFDATLVAHEYVHAITERMVGGPDSGLTSYHGKLMGEAWADLLAAEHLLTWGDPADTDPRVIGAYVGGNTVRGIRNYPLHRNPLNVTNLGYDLAGPRAHADAEVWTGVNWAVRRALVERYAEDFPADDRQLQRACARGRQGVAECPGNRRWAQLVIDSLLLQQGATSLLDGRDALLAADRMRFGGVHADAIWHAFAQRGMGWHAAIRDGQDTEPTADFSSPAGGNGTLIFRAVEHPSGDRVDSATIYVGRHEAGSRPVATANIAPADEADRTGQLPGRLTLVPGRYTLTWSAPGYGTSTAPVTVAPGTTSVFTMHLRPNLASAARGVEVAGVGNDLDALIDETERTPWSVRGDVASASAVVTLDGEPVTVRSVAVSALPRAGDGGTMTSADRFTALRSFAIDACTATAANGCHPGGEHGWARIYTSPGNAFPATRPRPATPTLDRTEFDVPATEATHLRLVVLANQCTGNPDYQSKQVVDPLTSSDCGTTAAAHEVRVAELEVYEQPRDALPPPNPHHAWG